jgi:hypothetical protein
MRFVDHQKRIRRQVIEQRRRWLARRLAGEMPGVVLDTVAVPHLGHHFQVELGTLRQALRLDQLVLRVQLLQALLELELDGIHRAEHALPRGRVVRLRVHRIAHHLAQAFAGERIEHAQLLDLAIEQFDAQRLAVGFRREHVDHLAPDPERAAMQLVLVARVLQLGQVVDQVALLDPLTLGEDQPQRQIVFRRAQAVDSRYRGHHQRIGPRQQGLGRRQPHLLDVLVDRAVLLDEGVRRGNVGLWLVVVVVADEVLHRVVREERLELAVQLRGQGLVRRHHQGRLLDALNHVGDGVGLAGAGHTQQGLFGHPRLEIGHQLLDRQRLVAGR